MQKTQISQGCAKRSLSPSRSSGSCCPGHKRRVKPQRAPSRTEDRSALVFRILLAGAPAILHSPKGCLFGKNLAKSSSTTSPSTTSTPAPLGKQNVINSKPPLKQPVPKMPAFLKGSTEIWDSAGGSGASESAAPSSLASPTAAVLCSCCNCLPFIEIFDEGTFQLCISCATRFERVKRKCTLCHYIPKAEERNRRQCSQCRGGAVKCYS